MAVMDWKSQFVTKNSVGWQSSSNHCHQRRNVHNGDDDCQSVGDDDDDDDDDDDGYPANYHQSYSHLVGICHNDEGWEYDTVKFPPYT